MAIFRFKASPAVPSEEMGEEAVVAIATAIALFVDTADVDQDRALTGPDPWALAGRREAQGLQSSYVAVERGWRG